MGRTHNAATLLRQLLKEDRFPARVREQVEKLAEASEALGPEVHVKSDYGDEAGLRTPWELFAESDAREAFGIAEPAIRLATELADRLSQPP